MIDCIYIISSIFFLISHFIDFLIVSKVGNQIFDAAVHSINAMIQYRSTFEVELMRIHRNFIPSSRTKMWFETANHRWGIVFRAMLWDTHGLIQMRAFESIKFTAFPKSARNPSLQLLLHFNGSPAYNGGKRFYCWSRCHSPLTKLILYLSINGGRDPLIILKVI